MKKHQRILLSTICAPALLISANAEANNNQNVEEYEGTPFLLDSSYYGVDDQDAAATLSIGGTVSTEYKDNIYRSKLLKDSDTIVRFKPGMRIRTDLKPYEYRLDAKLDAGKYVSEDENDYIDVDVKNRFSYDISQTTNVFVDGRFRYDHVDIGAFADDPDVLVADPTTYRYYEAGAGIEADMPSWYAFLEGRGEYINYDNDDRRNGTRKINDDRDHLVSKATTRVGYKPYEHTVFYAQATGNQRDYDHRIDGTATMGRDSDGYEILFGVDQGDYKGPVWVDAGVGFMSQDYSTAGMNDVETLALRANAQYRPNNHTRIRGELTRDVRETTSTGTSSYIQTRGRVRADTKINDTWVLGGGARYTQNDFQINPGSGAASRTDDVFDGNIYLDYMITDIYSIGAEYIYVTRSSDNAAAEYDSNTFLIRVGARY